MKSFIKWAGGKAKLADKICEFIPMDTHHYYEPFLGGGSVFWHQCDGAWLGNMPDSYLSDVNWRLVNCWRYVRKYPNEVIDVLERFSVLHALDPSQTYLDVREAFNCAEQGSAAGHSIMNAARFIYLNKTSFNGLYRENRKGEYNTPFGKKDTFKVPREDIKRCSMFLQDADIYQAGYDEVEYIKGPETTVYFDPPYVPASATSNFTAYSSEGFDWEDQVRLRNKARDLCDAGVNVILSNSDTELVRELYYDFDVHEILAARAINSKGDGRGKVKELIIVGRR